MSDKQLGNDSREQEKQSGSSLSANPFSAILADTFGSHAQAAQPLDSKSAKSVQDIETLLKNGNEKDAQELLYKVWDRSEEHSPGKEFGDFKAVVGKLEEDSKNNDIFHQVHAEKWNDGGINRVKIGVDSGFLTHNIFDSSKSLDRHKDEDKKVDAAGGLYIPGFSTMADVLGKVADHKQ